jgi:outer membrane protein
MRVVVFVLIVMVCLTSALGQPKPLTLDQAIQVALERNLNVVQAQNNVDAAQSQVLAARGQWLPTLSAGASANRSRQEIPSSGVQLINGIPIESGIGTGTDNISFSSSYSARLSAGWTVFDGLSREADNSAATSRAVASELSSTRTRQTTVFAVTAAYFNVMRTAQLVTVAEENVKRDGRQLERITESNRVGASSLADVYRQQSQYATDELVLINAQNNSDKSKADLLALIGLNVLDEYQLVDASIGAELDSAAIVETVQKYKSFSDLIKRAMQARPDYQGARENVVAADAGVQGARSLYFPSLSLGGSYSRYGSESNSPFRNSTLSWGVNLNWTIFDGFRTNQGLQTAIATRRNAEVTLAQTERSISVEVTKALLDLEAARKSLEVSGKAVTSASEDRKIAEERYNLGAGTLLDLMIANANYVNAEANRVNASYDFIIAKRNVDSALGERTY